MLIKNTITIRFEKGENQKATKIKQALRKLEVDFDQKQDVHHLTLSKFAKELLEDGKAPDLQKLGLFKGRTAKITLPI